MLNLLLFNEFNYLYVIIIMVEIDDNNEIYEELTITDIKMLLEYTQFKNKIF